MRASVRSFIRRSSSPCSASKHTEKHAGDSRQGTFWIPSNNSHAAVLVGFANPAPQTPKKGSFLKAFLSSASKSFHFSRTKGGTNALTYSSLRLEPCDQRREAPSQQEVFKKGKNLVNRKLGGQRSKGHGSIQRFVFRNLKKSRLI